MLRSQPQLLLNDFAYFLFSNKFISPDSSSFKELYEQYQGQKDKSISKLIQDFLLGMALADCKILGAKILSIFEESSKSSISKLEETASSAINPILLETYNSSLECESTFNHQVNYNSANSLSYSTIKDENNPPVRGDDEMKSLNYPYHVKSSKFYELQTMVRDSQKESIKIEMHGTEPHSLSHSLKSLPQMEDMTNFAQELTNTHEPLLRVENQTIFDRLHNENVKKRNKMLQIQIQKSQHELEKCTFRPIINHSVSASKNRGVFSHQSVEKHNTHDLPNQSRSKKIHSKGIGALTERKVQRKRNDENNHTFIEPSPSKESRSYMSNSKTTTKKGTNKDLMLSQMTSRHELLYSVRNCQIINLLKDHQDKQARIENKKSKIEAELKKVCTFQPDRVSKKFEEKAGLLQSLDSLERIYKFQVGSVLKKYSQPIAKEDSVIQEECTVSVINQRLITAKSTAKKASQQQVIVTEQQRIKQQMSQQVKERIQINKARKNEEKQQNLSKLMHEYTVSSRMNSIESHKRQSRASIASIGLSSIQVSKAAEEDQNFMMIYLHDDTGINTKGEDSNTSVDIKRQIDSASKTKKHNFKNGLSPIKQNMGKQLRSHSEILIID